MKSVLLRLALALCAFMTFGCEGFLPPKKPVLSVLPGPEKTPSFTVVIDRGRPLDRLLFVGGYDEIDPAIRTATFFPRFWDGVKNEQIGSVDVELISFDRSVTTIDALELMREQGISPVTFDVLLSVGAAHPELQRGPPIAALGTIVTMADGQRGVPFLGGDSRQPPQRTVRVLRTGEADYAYLWGTAWRFLVLKPSKPS